MRDAKEKFFVSWFYYLLENHTVLKMIFLTKYRIYIHNVHITIKRNSSAGTRKYWSTGRRNVGVNITELVFWSELQSMQAGFPRNCLTAHPHANARFPARSVARLKRRNSYHGDNSSLHLPGRRRTPALGASSTSPPSTAASSSRRSFCRMTPRPRVLTASQSVSHSPKDLPKASLSRHIFLALREESHRIRRGTVERDSSARSRGDHETCHEAVLLSHARPCWRVGTAK